MNTRTTIGLMIAAVFAAVAMPALALDLTVHTLRYRDVRGSLRDR
jgi:hypothetical protein